MTEPRYTIEFVGLEDEDALARIPQPVRANLERALRETIDKVSRELEQRLIFGVGAPSAEPPVGICGYSQLRRPSTGQTRPSFGIVRTNIA